MAQNKGQFLYCVPAPLPVSSGQGVEHPPNGCFKVQRWLKLFLPTTQVAGSSNTPEGFPFLPSVHSSHHKPAATSFVLTQADSLSWNAPHWPWEARRQTAMPAHRTAPSSPRHKSQKQRAREWSFYFESTTIHGEAGLRIQALGIYRVSTLVPF